jgi:hypothetical protein
LSPIRFNGVGEADGMPAADRALYGAERAGRDRVMGGVLSASVVPRPRAE